MNVRPVQWVALVALLPFLLAACAEKHVQTYAGNALPADQIAVIERGDNEKTNPNPLCISVFGFVEQVDLRETLPNNKSVDVAPGRHDLVIAAPYFVSGLFGPAGQVLRRRFSADFEPRHTYRIYVRWRSCSFGMNLMAPNPNDLEVNVYDLATGKVVSREVPE